MLEETSCMTSLGTELVYPNARFLYGMMALGENQHNQFIEEKCTYVGREK